MAVRSAKPISRAKARNAAMLNLLATPGLGSLLCRRWIAGIGQLGLAIVGFVIFCIPAVTILTQYYRMGLSVDTPPQIAWSKVLIVAGAGIGLLCSHGSGRR